MCLKRSCIENVNTRPMNMMRIYEVVSFIIEESTWSICSIGTEKIIHSKLNMMENMTPESIVVLICLCSLS